VGLRHPVTEPNLALDARLRNQILSQAKIWLHNLSSCGLATVSRIGKIIGLFCKIASLLYGSFAKETYKLIDPTNWLPPHSVFQTLDYPITFCRRHFHLNTSQQWLAANLLTLLMEYNISHWKRGTYRGTLENKSIQILDSFCIDSLKTEDIK